MKRVKVITAVHGRLDSLSLMLEGLKDNIDQFEKVGIKLLPVFSCTTENELNYIARHDFRVGILQNEYLGLRHNELSQLGCNDFDYLMQMGSDDILTPEGVLSLASWIHQGAPFFGFDYLSAVDMKTGRVKQGRFKTVFGAGRCIRRDIFEASYPLWSDNKKRGLDGDSQTRIFNACGINPKVVTTHKPAIWDLKTGDNLNSWDSLPMREVKTYDVPQVLKGVVNEPKLK